MDQETVITLIETNTQNMKTASSTMHLASILSSQIVCMKKWHLKSIFSKYHMH